LTRFHSWLRISPVTPDGKSTSALLVCIAGPDAGKRVVVSAQPTVIGRESACEVASDDPEVASRHVTLRFDNGKLLFDASIDCAAFLDGQRFVSGVIGPAQQLRIGRSLWQVQNAPASSGGDFYSFLGGLGDRISEVAGGEKIEGFKISDMFSEIWRKRTDEDMENYFAVGTPCNTPKLNEVDTSWPKPWFFFKTFVLAVLIYWGFVFAYQEFNNDNLMPGLLVIGSFVMPMTLLILFFEINVLRNVPLYQVLKLTVLGGLLSLILSLFLYEWTKLGQSNTWFGALGVGLVEETGKAAALLLVLNKLKYRWILNGMLFGAVVGAGFAGFESAGYAYRYGTAVITTRGLLAICGGHVLWTALVAGALWRVRGDRKFEWGMLADLRFLRAFGLAVAMHMVWDAPLVLPFHIKNIVLGFVVWVALLSYLQMGLRQVRGAQTHGATEFFRRDSGLSAPSAPAISPTRAVSDDGASNVPPPLKS
jgi:RsiW-degrading membrane proteinase PrsW (M82 family)